VLKGIDVKKLVLSIFVAGSLVSAPVGFTASAGAVQCAESVPQAWTRPGGYCSLIGGGGPGGGTVTEKSGGDGIVLPAVECTPISFRYLKKGARLIVADVDPCDDDLCGAVELDLRGFDPGDRIRVASC
jgi:hypothetical protein